MTAVAYLLLGAAFIFAWFGLLAYVADHYVRYIDRKYDEQQRQAARRELRYAAWSNCYAARESEV